METIKIQIIKYLEGQGSWQFGGVVCRAIHDQSGTKESVVERRCRELVNEGFLLKRFSQVNGRGSKCVEYHIKAIELPPAFEPKLIVDNSQVALKI